MKHYLEEILGQKNFMRGFIAVLVLAFTMVYITTASFYPIPKGNIRIVDTVIGFLMGTGFTAIITYFFGSSQSSSDKDKLLKNEPTTN